MKIRWLQFCAVGPYMGRETLDFDYLESLHPTFLLKGRTGAGKTTVLDAISFALYGKVIGENSDQNRLRCLFAPPETKTEVDLVFASGNSLYRVVRSPKYLRPAKRGDKYIEQKPTVAFYKLTETQFSELKAGREVPLTPLGDRHADTEARIQEIVGLDFSQFAQTIVLPQGQFATFLKANTASRKVILEKIFHTQIYSRMEKIFAEKRGNSADDTFKIQCEISARWNQWLSGAKRLVLDTDANLLAALAAIDADVVSLLRPDTPTTSNINLAPQENISETVGNATSNSESEKTGTTTDIATKFSAYLKALTIHTQQLDGRAQAAAEKAESFDNFLTSLRAFNLDLDRYQKLYAEQTALQTAAPAYAAKKTQLDKATAAAKVLAIWSDLASFVSPAQQAAKDFAFVLEKLQIADIDPSTAQTANVLIKIQQILEYLAAADTAIAAESANQGSFEDTGQKTTNFIPCSAANIKSNQNSDEAESQRHQFSTWDWTATVTRYIESIRPLIEAASSQNTRVLSEKYRQKGQLESQNEQAKKLEHIDAAMAECAAEKEKINKDTTALIKQLEELTTARSAAHKTQEIWEKSAETLKKLTIEKEQLEAQLQTADELTAHISKLAEQLETASQELATAEKARVAAEKSEYELTSLWLQADAARLANALEPGDPCQVCGSTEHPFLAQWPANVPDAQAKDAAAALRAQAVEAQHQKEIWQTSLRTQIEDKRSELAKIPVAKLQKRDIKITQELAEAAKGKEKFDLASSNLLELDKKIATANEELNILRPSTSALQAKAESLAEQKSGILADLLVLLPDGESAELSGYFSADLTRLTDLLTAKISALADELAAHEDLDRYLSKQTKALENIDKTWQEFIRCLFSAIPLVKGAPNQANSAIETQGQQTEDKTTDLRATWENWSAVKDSALPDKERDTLAQELADYAIQKEICATQLATENLRPEFLSSRLAEFKDLYAAENFSAPQNTDIWNKPVTDPELKSGLAELAEQSSHFSKSLLASAKELKITAQTWSKALAEARNSQQQIIDQIEQLQQAQQKQSLLSELARLAQEGSSEEKISLSTYALLHHFNDVINAANTHLLAMSPRYLLRHDANSNSGSARGKLGLGLEIIDNEYQTYRATTSLSGGESFYVSLALALGLADVVKQYSGGIEIGTLFVDEGFGSLDQATLEQVLETLTRQTGGERLLGIISHVEHLSDYIPTTVEVIEKPGSLGSTLHIKTQ